MLTNRTGYTIEGVELRIDVSVGGRPEVMLIKFMEIGVAGGPQRLS